MRNTLSLSIKKNLLLISSFLIAQILFNYSFAATEASLEMPLENVDECSEDIHCYSELETNHYSTSLTNDLKKHLDKLYESDKELLRFNIENATILQNKLATELEHNKQALSQLNTEFNSHLKYAEDLKESSFSTITIVLTCVAVLITGMAAIIALFAFFGYREILSKAIQKAEEVALKTTEETSKKIFLEQVDKGTFDEIINDNIERIALRGVMAGRDLDTENKD